MIDRFLILDHGDSRPDAERIIFCDGAGGGLFRDESDLELSHWRPNKTPPEYRAGTSTEICFRFLDAPIQTDWTLAANNHLDVDGMLSIYALVHSRAAVAHRKTIVQAAEMGDFWSWGEPPAQRLFQGLTRLMNDRSEAEIPTQQIYTEAFERAPGLIDGTDPETAAIEDSLEPLWRGVAMIEAGAIQRTQKGDHFAQYVLPADVTRGQEDRASYVPGFNEAISSKAILWPQARAKWDAQHVSLVSVETPAGWRHDLWSPGYLWADTDNLWTVPGLHYRNGMESYDLNNPQLAEAVRRLQQSETTLGTWAIGDGVSPFHRRLQGIFPVVLRFVDAEGKPASSRLAPDEVADELSAVFA